ncbi:MAG: hypothetical protein PVI83_03310 [Lysobacterales bacterium]|jgi:hypothetical protein
MKYLVFILALMIALPTAQAGQCGTGERENVVEQAAANGHDCCPVDTADAAETESPCEDGAHCSGCCTAFSAVAVAFTVLVHHRPEAAFNAPLSSLFSSHSAPPFRPPIS